MARNLTMDERRVYNPVSISSTTVIRILYGFLADARCCRHQAGAIAASDVSVECAGGKMCEISER